MGQLTAPATVIGNAVVGGTANSVLFVGAGGVLAEDNANLWWDDTTNEFNALNGIFGEPGTEAGGITVDGVLYSSHLKSSDINDSDVAHFIVHRHSLTLPPIFVTSRSHSAGSGHAVVQNGDGLGQWYAVGWDGTDYAIGGTAGFFVDGVPGNNDMPTRFVIALSPNGTQTPTDRFTINENNTAVLSANSFEQRNSTNPQTFRIYNTFTDASNYERLIIGAEATQNTILHDIAGTGAARPLRIGQTYGPIFGIGHSTDNWNINTSAHFVAGTDNTFDIGATGATRPRSIYIGTSIQIEANNGLKLTTQTDGAAAQVGTLNNSPVAGNPAFWLPVTVNGNNRHIPCW